MFRYRLVLWICLSLSLLTHLEARTLKVGTFPWIGFAPLQVASAKGLWQKAGVDVEVVTFGSDTDALKAFRARKIDIMMSMIGNAFSFRQAGTPLVILAETGWSHGGDKLIARNHLKPAALKGATVGVYLNAAPIGFFLSRYLNEQGLKASDIRMEEAPPDTLTRDFIKGKYPLIVSYDPFALEARRQGQGEEAGDSARWPGVIPEGMLAQPDIASLATPAELDGFFKGWIDAVNWINNNARWKELFPQLRKAVAPTPDSVSELDMIAMLNSYRFHGPSKLLSRNKEGGGTALYLQQMHAYLTDIRSPAASLKPDNLQASQAVIRAAISTEQQGG
ncbi:ABC transporter substrate-binding protein [Leeia oryzae]|uniref:ABC transporter substrate-binding protein n=1 Tax=Leeia oryzae TaxID=356662 RepID=UPI00036BB821|nr:ABC transporter substrate-binding protein [Leeia oryzae]